MAAPLRNCLRVGLVVLAAAAAVLVLATPTAAAARAQDTCDNSTFPIPLNNIEILGLKQAKAASADACREACCEEVSRLVCHHP